MLVGFGMKRLLYTILISLILGGCTTTSEIHTICTESTVAEVSPLPILMKPNRPSLVKANNNTSSSQSVQLAYYNYTELMDYAMMLENIIDNYNKVATQFNNDLKSK